MNNPPANNEPLELLRRIAVALEMVSMDLARLEAHAERIANALETGEVVDEDE